MTQSTGTVNCGPWEKSSETQWHQKATYLQKVWLLFVVLLTCLTLQRHDKSADPLSKACAPLAPRTGSVILTGSTVLQSTLCAKGRRTSHAGRDRKSPVPHVWLLTAHLAMPSCASRHLRISGCHGESGYVKIHVCTQPTYSTFLYTGTVLFK